MLSQFLNDQWEQLNFVPHLECADYQPGLGWVDLTVRVEQWKMVRTGCPYRHLELVSVTMNTMSVCMQSKVHMIEKLYLLLLVILVVISVLPDVLKDRAV